MTTVRGVTALSGREWGQLVHVVLVLTMIEIGLRMGRLDSLAAPLGVSFDEIDRPDGPPVEPELTPDDRQALNVARKVLLHWPFPATCLRRSLLAGHLLRRRSPAVRVGVAKIDGVVIAHAWLEIDGYNLDPVGVGTVRRHRGQSRRREGPALTDIQRLYGLTVESDVGLHQDRSAPSGSEIDVRIRTGHCRARTLDQPAGRTLVHLEYAEPFYTFAERSDGTQLLRFYRSCEFEIRADFRDVVVHPFEGRGPGIEVVLTSGAMLAYQLYRRRRLVLHASAVDLGGRALAFVGNAGIGKSTMAALMCADGARLITDDVLAVQVTGGRTSAQLGATELRLRKGADTLADRFAGRGPGQRRSADDRQVLRLADGAVDRLPLSAIVIPQPDRELDRVVVRRVASKDALFVLLNFPRILGWQDSDVIAHQFASLSALVLVPVPIARVPWGPPFAHDLAAQLTRAIPTAC